MSLFDPIEKYDTDWADFSAHPDLPMSISYVLDNLFGNADASGIFKTLDQSHKDMLIADPSLDIKNLDDGFGIEAEKILAIQQKNSKGMTIIDINPGLLDQQQYPLTLPYEFLFDGTNFMPDPEGNFSKNFRTISIPAQGNFLKIEYIYENNANSNGGGFAHIRPFAGIKYESALQGTVNNDFLTGNDSSSYDQYARTKVFVNFADTTEKPHIVTRSGDYFKTYFSTITISLNIGAPKIRLTIGTNSEKYDGPSVADINSKLSMTGAGRLMADIDTVMSPFCLTDYDIYDTPAGRVPYGVNFPAIITNSTYRFPIIYNAGYADSGKFNVLGYSVLWITRLFFTMAGTLANSTWTRVNIYTVNTDFTGSQPSTPKRVHTFKIEAAVNQGPQEYTYEPNEPVRVVIPNGCTLVMELINSSSAGGPVYYTWSIDGYSFGELLYTPTGSIGPDPGGFKVFTTKFITDSTFLSDFNRIFCLKG